MKFQINHRWNASVLFECDLSAELEAASRGLQLGFAVKAALKARASLADADLADAYLAGANLARADLADAKNVPETNGSEAIQSGAPRPDGPAQKTDAERAAAFRARNPDVPVVENLDAKILAAVTIGGGTLNMSSWHTCQTTHCRAGWAITLAGPKGAALEAKYGPFRAGSMLYRASTGRVPHFFATTERAMEDIKRCAESAV